MERRILIEGRSGEIVEKKSRFIANVFKIESYEEAISYIEAIKKKYWDARHNCYAFVLGENNEVQRYSDDGEPQGTAGKPMLDIIMKEQVINCLVVVTRYFGGTLLGTGGLIRAYQLSTKEGLNNSVIITKSEGIKYVLSVDYNMVGKISYLTSTNNYFLINSEYAENVLVTIVVNKEEAQGFEKKITQLMNGKEEYIEKENIFFGVHDGTVLFV